jgi:hypothetical protein
LRRLAETQRRLHQVFRLGKLPPEQREHGACRWDPPLLRRLADLVGNSRELRERSLGLTDAAQLDKYR